MNWKTGLQGLALAGAMLLARSTHASVTVGDKPALEFKDAITGKPTSLAGFKGRILVVDFWATWCGPCMAEADHMVKLNTEFSPQGMQFIGISLDQDKPGMLSVAKEKGFAWPQYFDGQAWKTAPAQAWGVNSIPRTFIIGPEGTVLWTGHPAEIDSALADAFKKHPPQLVDPKLLADASSLADKVDAALKDGNARAAISSMSKISPEVRADKPMAARLTAIEKQVTALADKSLAEIEPLITEKKFTEAATRLTELGKALSGTTLGPKANKRLIELNQLPEFKAQMDADRKTKAVEEEITVARRLATDGKDQQAYLRYKAIVANYPGVPAVDTAKQAVAEYEKNPELVKKATDDAVAGKAKAALKMADSYVKAGRKDLASRKYNEVIQQFPGTSYAKTAAEQIKTLD